MVIPSPRRRFVLAALWCALAMPAAAQDPIARSEIRQNLFATCFHTGTDWWMVGELGRIYHTTDGGKTILRSQTGTRDAFLSIACLPDGSVVAVGQKGLAVRSRDAGKTWQRLDTGTERELLSVDFATPQVGIAVGDYGTMIRTTDGGDSWTSVPLPTDLVLPEDVAEIVEPGDVLLYDIDFVSPERGWVVGEFGTIFATADGGQTWTTQPSPVETTLFGVGFVDDQTGFAAGIDEVLLRTTDGGQTWVSQDVPGREGFVLGLYDVAVQGQVGWVIGDSGMLLRTTDGGATWTRMELPIALAGNWFRGLGLTPGAAGLIVGSEGLILVTDGEAFHELKGS